MNLADRHRRINAEAQFILPILVGAAFLIYLLLVETTVPSIAFTGSDCAAGMLCFDLRIAGLELQTIGERIRTFLPLLSWPAVLGVSFFGWLRLRGEPSVARPLSVALGLTALQVLLVVMSSRFQFQVEVQSVNLAVLLGIQALLVAAVLIGFRRTADPSHSGQLVYQTTFARLTLLTLVPLFIILVTGSVVKLAGDPGACPAWPWCPGGLSPDSSAGWLHVIHRLSVIAGTVQVALITWMAWRSQRFQVSILVSATIVAVLFLGQGFMGAVQAIRGGPGLLSGIHSATAAAVWAMLVVLVVQVGLAGRFPVDERLSAHRLSMAPFRFRDYVALTKPIVVSLLLITTYAGMVVGGQAWPGLSLTFWTLAGGALAAGGSSAINQYIDRNRDKLMSRTAKRPIPAGRLTPAEGLAFGVALCLLSFFVYMTFVNLAAALLAVLGIAYYVILYSMVLKQATVQNIVIGGGAGAIPPLVGWSAVTGSITLPALMLFVVVFFWTPPHFWALALVRRKDYQRAGVPMLPVVRGERETRWQIFLYTLVLVAITLVLPLFDVGGPLYFAAALVLGVGLIFAAYRVWRGHGNKVAWQMYRWSSLYLAGLFAALMLDAVL